MKKRLELLVQKYSNIWGIAILGWLVIVLFMPVTSSANHLVCNASNTIISGLWNGANAALGAPISCAPAATSGNTAPRADSPVAAAPTPQLDAATPLVGASTYVALGDSIAAGLGLPPTDNGEPLCGVSNQAYPVLVSAKTQLAYVNYACSGAKAGDLFTDQHLANASRELTPQITRSFASGTPSLVTITAGANDSHWQYFIRKCYIATCGTSTDRVLSSGFLAALRLKLNYALADISQRSSGQPPKVIVTGYYQPLSPGCLRQQTGVTAAELTWLTHQTDSLNNVIANSVANYNFARYAPVSFAGHELCTADPWVQDISQPAPFHPTAAGQIVISQAVLQKY